MLRDFSGEALARAADGVRAKTNVIPVGVCSARWRFRRKSRRV